MTSAVIEAGDGLPLTVPAPARGPDGRAAGTRAPRRRRRGAHLRRGRTRARPSWPGPCWPRGRAAGTRVGLLYPNGPEFVVAWLAAARIGAVSVPLSTFSTSAELAGLLRGADVAAPAGADAVPVAGLRGQPGGRPPRVSTCGALRPRFCRGGALACAASCFDLDEADPDVAPRAGRMPGCSPWRRTASATTCWSPPESAVTPGRPHGDRAHVGLDERAEGRDPLPRGADPPPRQPQPAARATTPDEILFSNSPFFWIGGFAYALLGHPGRRGHAGVLQRADGGGRPRRARARAPDDGERVRGVGRPRGAGPDVLRRGTSPPSGAATSTRSCRTASVRRDPELHHAMLGMTEAGSVCLASDDESEQPEHRRGSFGRPVPGLRGQGAPTDDGRGEAGAEGEVGELCLRGPFLMEGYDGRERHETFDRDDWFRTGDLVTVGRRRVPLLPGPEQRHDQDRRRQRVAPRGRGGHPRGERARRPCRRRRRRGPGAGGRPHLRAGAADGSTVSTSPSTSTTSRGRLRGRLSAYKVPRTHRRRPRRRRSR